MGISWAFANVKIINEVIFYTLDLKTFLLLVAVEATVTVLIGLLLDVDHPVFEPALEPQCKPLHGQPKHTKATQDRSKVKREEGCSESLQVCNPSLRVYFKS